MITGQTQLSSKGACPVFLGFSMTTFVPHEIEELFPVDPPWITFKNCKMHGYKPQEKVRLDIFRKECQEAVELAKSKYLTKI